MLNASKKTFTPTVYAGYFEKVNVNKALREIRVPNPFEEGGKPIKKYIFSKETGTGKLNIPKYKTQSIHNPPHQKSIKRKEETLPSWHRHTA